MLLCSCVWAELQAWVNHKRFTEAESFGLCRKLGNCVHFVLSGEGARLLVPNLLSYFLIIGQKYLDNTPFPGNVLSIWSDLYKRPLSNYSLSNARSKLFVWHCPLFFRTRKRMHSCPKTCFPLICAIRLNVCSSLRESAHSKKSQSQQEITLAYICSQLSSSRELPRWPNQKKVWQLHLEPAGQMESGDMGWVIRRRRRRRKKKHPRVKDRHLFVIWLLMFPFCHIGWWLNLARWMVKMRWGEGLIAPLIATLKSGLEIPWRFIPMSLDTYTLGSVRQYFQSRHSAFECAGEPWGRKKKKNNMSPPTLLILS